MRAAHVAAINDRVAVLSLLLAAPMSASHPDTPTVVHAVTAESIVAGWPNWERPLPGWWAVTACWTYGSRLLTADLDGQTVTVPWPPHTGDLRKVGLVRCRECWDLTGKRRPRTGLALRNPQEPAVSDPHPHPTPSEQP